VYPRYRTTVILFPLAAIWIGFVVWWAIRKGVFQAPPPPDVVRREHPPRTPGPHADGSASGRTARRVRRRRATAAR
jgi:hypothetical protein